MYFKWRHYVYLPRLIIIEIFLKDIRQSLKSNDHTHIQYAQYKFVKSINIYLNSYTLQYAQCMTYFIKGDIYIYTNTYYHHV